MNQQTNNLDVLLIEMYEFETDIISDYVPTYVDPKTYSIPIT